MNPACISTDLPFPVRRGKVRDVYDLGNRLLLVSSDRISAFDWVMPNGIPDKGRVLTGLSEYWFRQLGVQNHLITSDVGAMALPPNVDLDTLRGRTVMVKKCQIVPIECVARGYLEGSGWKEYQQSQTVCGVLLPAGLVRGSKLPEPIFTPATKAESGHDENISFEQMAERIGQPLAEELRARTLSVYARGCQIAIPRGILIADTKLEWGLQGDQILLADEVLTPDSSRFWPAASYAPGTAQPSFDKQFVRDYLETTSWDKNSPPPILPDDVVEKTRAKYIEAFERITGDRFEWK
jgi:phosphoribosylaminoimidazole-succinocarboxamide synthase